MNLLTWITHKLLIIQTGTILMKLKATLKLAILFSPAFSFWKFLREFLLHDIEFMTLIALAIIIDHIIGSWMWFKLRKFSLKRNLTGLLTKMGLCVAGFLLFEGFNVILTPESFVGNYFKIVTNLSLFLYPAGSAFMNMNVITRGKFPPIGWIEKIKKYNEDLDISKFQKIKNDYREKSN